MHGYCNVMALISAQPSIPFYREGFAGILLGVGRGFPISNLHRSIKYPVVSEFQVTDWPTATARMSTPETVQALITCPVQML